MSTQVSRVDNNYMKDSDGLHLRSKESEASIKSIKVRSEDTASRGPGSDSTNRPDLAEIARL